MQVAISNIRKSPLSHVEMEFDVSLVCDDGDEITILGARLIRNRLRELWFCPPENRPRQPDGSLGYWQPTVAVSGDLHRKILKLAQEAYTLWLTEQDSQREAWLTKHSA